MTDASAVAAALWQGDLLATPVGVALEAPEHSVLDGASDLQTVDDRGIWAPAAISIESGWAAIVTQTCDVVRDAVSHPYLQVMPVVALEEDEWTDALNGRRGSRFSLPPHDELGIPFPAIDPAIAFPVAKTALAHSDIQTLATPLDPAARILLSTWLMRRVGRHAFPDELEKHVLGPLRNKVRDAMDKNSPGGRLASTLLGIWCSLEWTASVSIILIVDQNQLTALGDKFDAVKAAEELISPARKQLAKSQSPVHIIISPRTLARTSAHDLLIGHRQVDLDVMPTGGFAADQAIEVLAGPEQS